MARAIAIFFLGLFSLLAIGGSYMSIAALRFGAEDISLVLLTIMSTLAAYCMVHRFVRLIRHLDPHPEGTPAE